jgi:hypothetical protein
MLSLRVPTKLDRRLLSDIGADFLLTPSEPKEGETEEQARDREIAALGNKELEHQISVTFWLLSAPIDDVRPGGSIFEAIQDATWRRAVLEFEAGWDGALDAQVGAILTDWYARIKASRRKSKPETRNSKRASK